MDVTETKRQSQATIKKITDKQHSNKNVSLAPQDLPVLVLGADGLDLKLIQYLISQNKLPNFKKLIETGAWGICLSEREMRSPALWTTISTGRPRSVHGIYDFVTGSRLWPMDQRNVEKRLVTSKMRKVPAIWNIAPEKKMAIIGWLNTWPAEEVNGVMVSPYVAIGSPKQVTIKGTVYPDIPHQVYPEERWEEIRSLIVTPEKISDSLINTFIEMPEQDVLSVFRIVPQYIKGLRWSLAHTLTMRNVTLHLLKTDSPDVTMVYFEGSDSLGHRFWLFRQSIQEIQEQLKEAGYPPQYAEKLKKAFGNVMNQYYIKLDTIIGELTKEMGTQSNLLICSDHGFMKRSKDNPVTKYVPFTGEHRFEGTLFIHGPKVRPNKQIIGATLYSIAPTILDLIGVTAPEDFEGTSLLKQVENNGTTMQAQNKFISDDDQTVELPFSDEEMDRLRSLGYLN